MHRCQVSDNVIKFDRNEANYLDVSRHSLCALYTGVLMYWTEQIYGLCDYITLSPLILLLYLIGTASECQHMISVWPIAPIYFIGMKWLPVWFDASIALYGYVLLILSDYNKLLLIAMHIVDYADICILFDREKYTLSEYQSMQGIYLTDSINLFYRNEATIYSCWCMHCIVTICFIDFIRIQWTPAYWKAHTDMVSWFYRNTGIYCSLRRMKLTIPILAFYFIGHTICAVIINTFFLFDQQCEFILWEWNN